MRRTSLWMPLAAMVLASACGARSSLQATAAATGAGGSTTSTGPSSGSTSSSVGGSSSQASGSGGAGGQLFSTSTSGSGGTGGVGGAGAAGGTGGTGGTGVLACPAVQIDMPVLTVADPGGGDPTQPSLVVVNAPPATAAIVYASQPPTMVSGPVGRVGGFVGWGAWPPALPTPIDMMATIGTTQNGPVPGVSLLAVTNGSSPGDSFGVLSRDYGGVTMDLLYETAEGGSDSSISDGRAGTVVALTSTTAGDWLFGGTSVPDASNYSFNVAAYWHNVGATNVPNIGCATSPIAAGVAATTKGWSLVVALGTAYRWDFDGYPCAQKFGTVGAATTLYFASVEAMGPNLTSGEALPLQLEAPATRVRVTPRDGGSWAVWGMQGVAALAGVRLGLAPTWDGTFSVGPQIGELVTTSFDVQRFGEGLLVGVVDEASDGTNDVEVAFLDSTGTLVWSAVVPADGAIDGAVSLVPSPAGDAILVAWSELPSGAMVHQLRIARLDCVPPP